MAIHRDRPLTAVLQSLEQRLHGLERPHIAAFFASCGERLMPLYEHFVQEYGCGDAGSVRGGLDAVWGKLLRNADADWSTLSAAVQAAVPDADEFDSVVVTLAQDACICVDVALTALGGGELDVGSVEYVFEAVRVAVCVEKTGYLDLGNGQDAIEFEQYLLQEPRFVQERQRVERDLSVLESAEGWARLEGLQAQALDERWAPAELLPHEFMDELFDTGNVFDGWNRGQISLSEEGCAFQKTFPDGTDVIISVVEVGGRFQVRSSAESRTSGPAEATHGEFNSLAEALRAAEVEARAWEVDLG